MKPKEIVESGYNKIYKNYHEARKKSKNQKELYDFTKNLPKRSKILDVGCGSGAVARVLVNKGFDLTGIDIFKNMIKFAKKNVPKAKFLYMDMTKLKFPSKSFDGITCILSMIHVPRKYHIGILKKFYKILKLKGLLLISVGLGDSEFSVEDNWLGAKMYWSHFDKETNLKLIRKSGFKVIWHRPVGPKNDRHLFVLAQK